MSPVNEQEMPLEENPEAFETPSYTSSTSDDDEVKRLLSEMSTAKEMEERQEMADQPKAVKRPLKKYILLAFPVFLAVISLSVYLIGSNISARNAEINQDQLGEVEQQVLSFKNKTIDNELTYSQLVSQINSLIEVYRDKPDLLERLIYLRGVLRSRNVSRFNEAIADFTEVIEKNPSNAEYYYLRGMIYKRLNKHDEALKDFNKAIELNPNFAEAFLGRGDLHSEKKNYNQAIMDYTHVISLNSGLAEAYRGLGLAHLARNELELAVMNLKEAQRIYQNLGQVTLFEEVGSLVLELESKLAEKPSKAGETSSSDTPQKGE